MRWCVSIGAVLVAGAMAGGDVAGIAAPNPAARNSTAHSGRQGRPSVDVELILAVDVSYSMDMDELAVQREGYAQAIVSKEFLQALKSRPERQDRDHLFRMGGLQRPEDHHSLAADRRSRNRGRRRRGNHEDADPPGLAHLDLGRDQFRDAAVRRGSVSRRCGASSIFPATAPTTTARPSRRRARAALAKGIVINGLPIMVKEPSYSTMDIENLDWYYEDCVIGGPGSFVVAIKDREKFKEAIRTKLLLEVAGRTPERRIVPVAEQGAAGVLPDRREDLAGPLGTVRVAFPGCCAARCLFAA